MWRENCCIINNERLAFVWYESVGYLFIPNTRKGSAHADRSDRPPQSVPVSGGFDNVTVDALPDTILKRNVFDINGAQIHGLPLHKGNDRNGFIDASDLTLRWRVASIGTMKGPSHSRTPQPVESFRRALLRSAGGCDNVCR